MRQVFDAAAHALARFCAQLAEGNDVIVRDVAEREVDAPGARAGSYYEPSLVDGVTGRFHGTGGFDVKLFDVAIFGLIEPFDYWQLSISADGARRYLATAFSIGFWH